MKKLLLALVLSLTPTLAFAQWNTGGGGSGTSPLASQRYYPPALTLFTTTVGTNSENPTATLTSDRGVNITFGTSPGAGDNIRGIFKNLNAAANQTIIANFQLPPWQFQYNDCGLGFTDGTKYVSFGFTVTGVASLSPQIYIQQWTNSTTFSASIITGGAAYGATWLRVDLVSGNLTNFFVSTDGKTWIQVYGTSMAAFITPTKVGFYFHVNRNAGTLPIVSTLQSYMNVLYYSDPDIVPAQ